MILQNMQEKGKRERLFGFEIVKAIHLYPREFSIDEDLITPTFKLKRNNLKKYFQSNIDQMYADYDREHSSIRSRL